MAQRLASFDFTAQSAITSAERKGRNRYPWGDWFDGDIWKLNQGEDFDTDPLMMERIIRTRASNKNHKALVTMRHLPAVNGDAPAIVLQRTDIVGPTAAKRAEAAAKRKAKKAAAEADAAALVAGINKNFKPPKATKPVSKRPSKRPSKAAR